MIKRKEVARTRDSPATTGHLETPANTQRVQGLEGYEGAPARGSGGSLIRSLLKELQRI